MKLTYITTVLGQRDTVQTGLSSFVLRIAGLFCTFGIGVVLARALGPADYGVYGLVVSVAALCMTVSLLGTPQLAVREFAVRSARGDWGAIKTLIRSFGWASTACAVLLGTIAIVVGYAASPAGHPAPHYIILGAMLTLVMTVTALIAAELRGLGAMLKGQFMDIAGRPAAAFLIYGAIVVAGAPLSAGSALWVQVAVAAIAALISLVWIRRALTKAALTPPDTVPVPWIAMAIPLWLVDVLRQVDGTYGMILMGWFGTAEELGIYRVAFSCMVVVGMPISILHIIQAPAVSKLHKFGDRQGLQQLLSMTSAWMVLLIGPITIATWLIGRPAIALVFGPAYEEAWLPLFILCLSQLLFGLFGMGPILLAMCDGERHLIRIYLLAVGMGVLAAVPLVISFSASGAAAAIVLSNGLIGFLSWRYGVKNLGVNSTFVPLLRKPVHG